MWRRSRRLKILSRRSTSRPDLPIDGIRWLIEGPPQAPLQRPGRSLERAVLRGESSDLKREDATITVSPPCYTSLYLHIVFSTLRCRPFLQNYDLRRQAHDLMSALCLALGSPPVVVGGMADHAHVLCASPLRHPTVEFIEQLQLESTYYIRRLDQQLEDFEWQRGFVAVSVSPTEVAEVQKSIAFQARRHRTMTFQEEYLKLLKDNDIPFEADDLWE